MSEQLKLPRGQYWIVKLGSMYYGGKLPVKHVFTIRPAPMRGVPFSQRKSTTVEEFAGRYKDRFVEDKLEAKRYRMKKQAEQVAELLELRYKRLQVTVKLEFLDLNNDRTNSTS